MRNEEAGTTKVFKLQTNQILICYLLHYACQIMTTVITVVSNLTKFSRLSRSCLARPSL